MGLKIVFDRGDFRRKLDFNDSSLPILESVWMKNFCTVKSFYVKPILTRFNDPCCVTTAEVHSLDVIGLMLYSFSLSLSKD